MVGVVYNRKIKHINNIECNLPNINEKDFISWKIEFNKDLLSFWELITEDIKE